MTVLLPDVRHDDDLRPRVPGPVEEQRPAGPRGPRRAAARRAPAQPSFGALHVEGDERSRGRPATPTSAAAIFSRAGLRHHPIVCTPISGPNRSTFRSASVCAPVQQRRPPRHRRRAPGRSAVRSPLGQPLDDIPAASRRQRRRTRRAGRSRCRGGHSRLREGGRGSTASRDQRGEHEAGPRRMRAARPATAPAAASTAHGVRAVRADDADVAARGRRAAATVAALPCHVDALADESARRRRRPPGLAGAQVRAGGRAAAVEQPGLAPARRGGARAERVLHLVDRPPSVASGCAAISLPCGTPDSWLTTACQRGQVHRGVVVLGEHPPGPRQADPQHELLDDRRPPPERLDAGDVLAGQHQVDALRLRPRRARSSSSCDGLVGDRVASRRTGTGTRRSPRRSGATVPSGSAARSSSSLVTSCALAASARRRISSARCCSSASPNSRSVLMLTPISRACGSQRRVSRPGANWAKDTPSLKSSR